MAEGKKELAEVVADAVIAQAQRACREKACGCSPGLGKRGRAVRCSDCPLDDVELVVEELWARSPAPVGEDEA